MKLEMLDALLVFASGVSTRRQISDDKDLQLYEVVCLEDELQRHDYLKEEYWTAVGDHILKTY